MVPDQPQTKPSVDEWITWAQVVIDRLSICAHVYSKPPHADAAIEESVRQQRNAEVADLMRRIHAVIDESEAAPDDLDAYHERVAAGLAALADETLQKLPALSHDMQVLLKSPWQSRCNGRVAEVLFRGPMANEQEGIGDGHPEHGRLPEVLQKLLERERTGETRQDGDADALSPLPERHDDLMRRWREHTRGSYRSEGVGRIE